MAMYEGISIPEVIETDFSTGSSSNMLTAIGVPLLRHFLKTGYNDELNIRKSENALYASISKASTEMVTSGDIQKSLDFFNDQREIKSAAGDAASVNMIDANMALIQPNLIARRKVESFRDEVSKLEEAVEPLKNKDGYDEGLIKLINELDERYTEYEPYIKGQTLKNLIDLQTDTNLKLTAEMIKKNIDKQPEVEGVQLLDEDGNHNYVGENTAHRASVILDIINKATSTDDVDRDAIRVGTSEWRKLLTDEKVATTKQLSEKEAVKSSWSKELDMMWEGIDEVLSIKPEDMMEKYGDALGDPTGSLALMKNVRSLVKAKSINPTTIQQYSNIALSELAKIVSQADDVPAPVKKVVNSWKGSFFNSGDQVNANSFYDAVAYWEIDAYGKSKAAEGWDANLDISGWAEGSEDKNLRNLAMMYMNVLQKLKEIDVVGKQLYPIDGYGILGTQLTTSGKSVQDEILKSLFK
tara:strand:+ start:4851 stop:6257 length:1407 start_codon:yes stop_codon:yes gene_type:complete